MNLIHCQLRPSQVMLVDIGRDVRCCYIRQDLAGWMNEMISSQNVPMPRNEGPTAGDRQAVPLPSSWEEHISTGEVDEQATAYCGVDAYHGRLGQIDGDLHGIVSTRQSGSRGA